MPLTAKAISEAVEKGEIVIKPFDPAQLNPNSYNVCLGDELGVYIPADTPGMAEMVDQCIALGSPLPKAQLDCRKDNPLHCFKMPEAGVLLHPGKLYLGSTVEFTNTPRHVPFIEGRSSLARLGIKAHITGGFGDIGFRGHWTLEIEVTEPVRIYPFMEFAQVYFHLPSGAIELTYQGKYLDQVRPTASRLHQEMTHDPKTNDIVAGDDSSADTPDA
jgi:dCTP deaminase